jgi:hypothetical protein
VARDCGLHEPLLAERFAATVTWRPGRKTASGTTVQVFAIRVGPSAKALSADDLIAGERGRVEVALPELETRVTKVAFAVVAEGPDGERPLTFGRLRGAVIAFTTEPGCAVIATYDLTEEFDRDGAVVPGEIVRSEDCWRFRPMGHAWDGGLAAIRRDYGIDG